MSSRLIIHRHRACLGVLALVALAHAASGCGGGTAKPPADTQAADTPAAPADAPLAPPALESALPEAVRAVLAEPFTGDLDQMVKRRLIRVGVPLNRTFYFVDNGVQRGAAYEFGQAFEEHLNKKLKTKNATKVHVFFVPLPRDLLAPALTQGRIDCAVAQVIVRPELEAIVDFTRPTRTNVSEVVVTGPGAPAIATVDDLSGKDVYARKDSSAWESLVALNEQLKAKGRPPVAIREVPGNLEDDDLLEMVNAGLVPAVVTHDYLAAFWKEIFTDLTVHDTVPVRTGASLAVPVRKNEPALQGRARRVPGEVRPRDGVRQRHREALPREHLLRQAGHLRGRSGRSSRELGGFFQKYGDQYQLDCLLMAAQGYQESGLDQNVKSRVGAVGVMQVMPATGRELKVGDIRQLEPNIHAGVKYIRFMIDQYFKDEPMDQLNKGLFAFASYNAGPARIRQLRKEAEKRGLDPNVWFGNVEQIASERIGRETVTYVSNIYKYYIAYRLVAEERARREEAKKAVRTGAR